NESSTEYFGVDGKPVNNKDGWSKVIRTSKGPRQLSDLSYFDKDGKPLRMEVFISKLIPGFQSESLGLKAGDVWVSENKREISDMRQVEIARQETRLKGESEELIFLRGSQKITVHPKPGAIGISQKLRAASVTK